MKVVSFNVNSVRVRLHQIQKVVETIKPDIIGLQETKVCNEDFPIEAIANMGYEIYFHGQKGHYGVAIMSKTPATKVTYGFPSDTEESQKRLITCEFLENNQKITIINGYFPQGESRDHPTKFPAKEKFYRDLQILLNKSYFPKDKLIVMGDINIASDDNDIGIGEINAKRWLRTGKTSFLPEEREWYKTLISWGLTDTYRYVHPHISNRFSWFDYRSKGFDDEPKRGLRIDQILVTKSLLDDCTEVGIDYDIRGMQKPSDHCPIWANFQLKDKDL